MISVLFFGKLREAFDCSGLSIASDSVATTNELLDNLLASHPDWETLLTDEQTQMAVNQALVKHHVSLASGDEVAFFPPVTGG